MSLPLQKQELVNPLMMMFQLVRHFNGLQSLLSTLAQASKELGLLMVLVWVIVLFFRIAITFHIISNFWP